MDQSSMVSLGMNMNPFYQQSQNLPGLKMDSVETENSDGSDAAIRKPWMKRPGAPITKVAPDVKRRRKNYQAKKLLAPKNPLMVLNELKPGLPFTILDKSNGSSQPNFIASVEIDGRTFSGQGISKKQAQQDAAENALKGLFFDKLVDQLMKKDDGDVEMKDVNQTSVKTDVPADPKPQTIPEDDTPWSSLASFAMFKLVNLWQNADMKSSGHSISSESIPALSAFNQFPIQPQPQINVGALGKLPPNPSEIDPVMLLNQISPFSKFTELERDVRDGSTVFTLTVEFNGQSFSGSASKKKLAKKICAKNALKSYGVVYAD
ncbi:double-stranded RNA-specific editase B2 [Frankliniella occidentalis]|uniref:Double-stranded RNA-specific editase B2 n=1 Tax=Frankliniella occidentalis TaxID=133901 RepID=A0A6J1SLV4_FRAOC|nr:double-stranded RNA-specific editase B2 [Frankliniella occidentalis]XP_026281927.1 double-stranded RNA-specific editase B2 [Frankliniella occidentalis]